MSQPPQPGEPEGQAPDPGPQPGQPYPQQPYPRQPYQQQGWYGAPQQPPPSSNKTALWVGLGVLGLVVVVAVVAILGFVTPGFFLSDSKGESAVASSSAPASSSQETATQSPVNIPSARTELPKRTTPLADPTECAYPADTSKEAAKKVNPPAAGPTPASGTAAVTVKTSAGDIGLTLDRGLAPCTVANFLSLAQQGYYDGTSCHRLGVSGLQMLQCGDPEGSGMGGPGYTIPDEIFPQLKYGRGLIAMAKTQNPDSGGSQFFMVFGEAELPPEYTVFGSISDEGLQTLDKVARGGVDAEKGSGDGTGPPRIEVKFQSIAVG